MAPPTANGAVKRPRLADLPIDTKKAMHVAEEVASNLIDAAGKLPSGDDIRALAEVIKETNVHLAYGADSVGKIANGFEKIGKIGKTWGPWVVAALGVIFPNLKDIINWVAAHVGSIPTP